MYAWKQNVREVTPYVPGEQPRGEDIIKLNTNENPYPPADAVRQVLREFDEGLLRKYPDPDASLLVDALADAYGVGAEQVFVGVGSDDVLAMSFLTFFYGKKPILFPDITYSFYDVWAELFRIPYETQPLDPAFQLRKEDYFRENGGIVIANPNAPTGEQTALSDIEEILKQNPGSVVIVDEAYIDFGGESALPLIERYDNLLVVQTFSKSRAMAGARIGYAFGCKALIDAMKACKFSFNSYTMDAITLRIGAAALGDKAYFEKTIERIKETRRWTIQALRDLGFQVADSKTNFVFATHPAHSAEVLFAALKERRIFVRYFQKPRIDNFLRITIGTEEEMHTLIETMEEICSSTT